LFKISLLYEAVFFFGKAGVALLYVSQKWEWVAQKNTHYGWLADELWATEDLGSDRGQPSRRSNVK